MGCEPIVSAQGRAEDSGMQEETTMLYRSFTVAVVCALAASQSAWAQPPGRGGRNQEDALRKLEQEVAQLKDEIKKLQQAQRQSTERQGGPGASAQGSRRGGPPAMADRRGGPGGPPAFGDRRGGPGGPPAFAGRRGGPGGFGGPRGGMAFRGQQFGPPGWNQWQRPQQGFGPNGFQARGFDQRRFGDPSQFSRGGPGGRPGFGPQQRFQPPRRGDFRTPTRGERGESVRGRQGERPTQPPRSRPDNERRDERPRPERRPAA